MERTKDALRIIIQELRRGNNVFMEETTDARLQEISHAVTLEARHRNLSEQLIWNEEIVMPILKQEFAYTDEQALQLRNIIFPDSMEWNCSRDG